MENNQQNYLKYLKYKKKYFKLKNQIGGDNKLSVNDAKILVLDLFNDLIQKKIISLKQEFDPELIQYVDTSIPYYSSTPIDYNIRKSSIIWLSSDIKQATRHIFEGDRIDKKRNILYGMIVDKPLPLSAYIPPHLRKQSNLQPKKKEVIKKPESHNCKHCIKENMYNNCWYRNNEFSGVTQCPGPDTLIQPILNKVKFGDKPIRIFNSTYDNIRPQTLLTSIFNFNLRDYNENKLSLDINKKLNILAGRSEMITDMFIKERNKYVLSILSAYNDIIGIQDDQKIYGYQNVLDQKELALFNFDTFELTELVKYKYRQLNFFENSLENPINFPLKQKEWKTLFEKDFLVKYKSKMMECIDILKNIVLSSDLIVDCR